MKKIIFSLIVLFALISCDDKSEDVKPKWNPEATILIKQDKSIQTRSAENTLSALEIVEQTVNIKWQSHYESNVYWDSPKTVARGFGDYQRDFEIPALKMLGIDVISQEGDYYRDMTHSFNVYLTDDNNDSIAYIPDETIALAKVAIEAAYNAEDYEEVYRLFHDAFTFIPLPIKE